MVGQDQDDFFTPPWTTVRPSDRRQAGEEIVLVLPTMFAPFLLSTPNHLHPHVLDPHLFPPPRLVPRPAPWPASPRQAHARGAAHVVIREHIPFLQFIQFRTCTYSGLDPRIRFGTQFRVP